MGAHSVVVFPDRPSRPPTLDDQVGGAFLSFSALRLHRAARVSGGLIVRHARLSTGRATCRRVPSLPFVVFVFFRAPPNVSSSCSGFVPSRPPTHGVPGRRRVLVFRRSRHFGRLACHAGSSCATPACPPAAPPVTASRLCRSWCSWSFFRVRSEFFVHHPPTQSAPRRLHVFVFRRSRHFGRLACHAGSSCATPACPPAAPPVPASRLCRSWCSWSL